MGNPPDVKGRIPYRAGRTKPCSSCGHRTGGVPNCPCTKCRQRYSATWAEEVQQYEIDERERVRERDQRRARETAHALAVRTALEAKPRIEQPTLEDLCWVASTIVEQHGSVADDGGLWLTLAAPIGRVDVANDVGIIAHLQVRGMARFVGAEALERGRIGLVYLITMEPTEAEQVGLVGEPLLGEWRRARSRC